MESVLLVLLYLSGWFILPSCPLRQYYFVNEPLTWHEAQTYCRERFKDLATIDNMTEMNQLIDTISSAGYTNVFWIGAFSEINWRWSDGSVSEYRRWKSGQPNSVFNDLCVRGTASGGWSDVSCRLHYPFMCYEGTQQNPEFKLVEQPMNWSDAQKYCRENYVDLATVRNDAEQQSLGSQLRWFGITRDADSQWSDGSSVRFSYWVHGGAILGTKTVICGAASLLDSGKWRLWYCDKKFPFVCYNQAVYKQVVKLRIKLDDSSVDLNDPAVKAALLKKLQDRLKEEGVNGVNLKWKEQPDGEVWHKEEL